MRTKLTDTASIAAVIKDLTVEEKAKFLILPSPCVSQAIPEMDIPSIVLADGATGVNGTHIILDFLMEMMAQAAKRNKESKEDGDAKVSNPASGMGNIWIELQELIASPEDEAEKMAEGNPIKMAFLPYLKKRRNEASASVSFPSGINIGATFRPEQANRLGAAVGREMRSANMNVCLGPNVDVMRDPLGGRNYEMYGEDPTLVSRIAPAFVSGMQSQGTAACAKHYIANNQEERRQSKDTHVSTRTLREIYAKGFEASVKKAGVKSVMSAYNAVNGQFSSYNKMILTDWLKDEWGFEGVVVSDWGAAGKHPQDSIAAGLDVALNGPQEKDYDEMIAAIQGGRVSMERVDDAVARFLELVIWIRDNLATNPVTYDGNAIKKTAYDTIVDGTVLLKNDQSLLPLSTDVRTAFYGSRARDTMECGSGSTMVTTHLHSNVFEESGKLGVAVRDGDMTEADVVVYVAGAEGGENADRPEMKVDKADQQQMTQVLKQAKDAGKKTVVILNVAGPVDVQDWEPFADAIFVVFVPGCMGGKVMADILYGKAIPAGRLPVTFPRSQREVSTFPYFGGEYDDVYYAEGVFVGYRWYESRKMPVSYPFGYGLTYTSFDISDIRVPEEFDTRADDVMTVMAKVKNIGAVTGSEVVQVYMRENHPKLARPVKELKGFTKVDLAPGEEKEIEITVTVEDLIVYDPQKGAVLPVGDYTVMVGTDCSRILYETGVRIVGDNVYCLGRQSSLGDILAVPEAIAIVEKVIPGMVTRLGEHAKLMAGENLDALVSKQIIQSQPDAVKAQEILDKMYEELAALSV